ncbi:MAG TPA: hypothetical protein PKZ84_07550 [Anaerolineae bacterium]|nr:hypothetical protein [Anaerolineae bacterium]HQI84142.1 hypothetical protein [Anaerolineae bacterium]
MQYYSEEEAWELRAVFEKEVLTWPEVTLRRMFGCPAYVADGRLFAFLVTDGVVITQLRRKEIQTLAQDNQIEPFKAGERVIERWTKVTVVAPQTIGRIMAYVRKSYQTALDRG